MPTAPTLGKPKLKSPDLKPIGKKPTDAAAQIDFAISAGTKLAESGALLSKKEAKKLLKAELKEAGIKGGVFTNLAYETYAAARATPLKPIPCELSRETQDYLTKEAGALVSKGPLGAGAKEIGSTFKNAVKALGLEGDLKREARRFFFDSFRTQAAEQWIKDLPVKPREPRNQFPVLYR